MTTFITKTVRAKEIKIGDIVRWGANWLRVKNTTYNAAHQTVSLHFSITEYATPGSNEVLTLLIVDPPIHALAAHLQCFFVDRIDEDQLTNAAEAALKVLSNKGKYPEQVSTAANDAVDPVRF